MKVLIVSDIHGNWPALQAVLNAEWNTDQKRTLVVNPGSVGQPKHGDPRAAYALWQDGLVALKRAPYPVEETVRAFAQVDIEATAKHRLVEELRTGRQAASQKRVQATRI